jgi:hypothetical protein
MRWTTVLIAYPWLSLVAATLLLWLWWRSRSTVTLVAGLLWIAYAAWEYAVREGPDANIRIDLLLIYPLLAAVTLAGLWFGRHHRASRPDR